MVRIYKKTFNQTVEHYINTKTAQSRKQVWIYINSMPTLYFIQCGQQSCPVPWIMFEQDEPIAMVFTNPEHALQVAKSVIEDGENIRVVGLPTNAAAMYMTAIAAQGVQTVCFNHGPSRFDASMDEVLLSTNSMTRF
ncbi:MAG: hypothetical protein CMJ26_00945 [Phycisphaerae bacterium]|nr:hypothetical protein [Phycisphaerae bacterium]|tara:strand:+ start:1982 stop:2392 length:411 start_codon:yes stop_codon:yes gene_type:complete